jgi:hypothetical protein
MQCSGALLPASCSALRSLPEACARERLRTRDKRTSIRVYRGGVRISIVGGVGTGVRRVGPGARSLCREATLHTRLLAFLGSDDCEAAAPWFPYVLKPARRNVVAAAAVSARRGRCSILPGRSAAALVKLRDSALQGIQLRGDGVE